MAPLFFCPFGMLSVRKGRQGLAVFVGSNGHLTRESGPVARIWRGWPERCDRYERTSGADQLLNMKRRMDTLSTMPSRVKFTTVALPP